MVSRSHLAAFSILGVTAFLCTVPVLPAADPVPPPAAAGEAPKPAAPAQPYLAYRSAAPVMTLDQILKECSNPIFWQVHYPAPKLDRNTLVRSLEDIRTYLRRQQRADGLFTCEYDLLRQRKVERDDQTAQAAALWALARLQAERPSPETLVNLQRGLSFFYGQTRRQPLDPRASAPVFPDDGEIRTATVGFLALAIMDYLSVKDLQLPQEARDLYIKWLDHCLFWLQKMEAENGSWAFKYIPAANERDSSPDAQTDGVCLYAYTRAVLDFNYKEFAPRLRAAREKLLIQYLAGAWCGKSDPFALRRFAPYAALALGRVAAAGEDPGAAVGGNGLLSLAWWHVYAVDAMHRERQPAVLAVPLLSAARVARARGDTAADAILSVTAQSLTARTLQAQAGSPLWRQNPLVFTVTVPEALNGGIAAPPDYVRIRLEEIPYAVVAIQETLALYYPETPAAPAPPSPAPVRH